MSDNDNERYRWNKQPQTRARTQAVLRLIPDSGLVVVRFPALPSSVNHMSISMARLPAELRAILDDSSRGTRELHCHCTVNMDAQIQREVRPDEWETS